MSHSASPAAAPARLARLDGLRGIAACGVAFTYHTRSLFAEGALDTGIYALDWFQLYGWLFVDMFFVLSGFIFAHVYLSRNLLTSGAGVAEFAVARFARLYPLHLLLLLATLVLFWGKPENTPIAFVANFLFLQALAQPPAQSFVGPSWSLTVEAACYVLFALGAAAGPRALRLVTGFAIALGLIAILIHASPAGPYARDDFPRGLLGFFLGQLLWHRRAALARVPSWCLGAVMVAGLLVPPSLVGAILPLALLTFPAALLLGLRTRWLESRLFVWLGDRSYAIYLIHIPVIELVVKWHGPIAGGALPVALGLGGLIAAVLLLSELAFHTVEDPARKAIRAAWLRRENRAALA